VVTIERIVALFHHMSESKQIALFPLKILPLEGERVPLHIFEPRYRQLVQDLEEGLQGFGILYSGSDNNYMLGTYMTLRKVIKYYDSGESDILCTGGKSFIVQSYQREYPEKLYPGGQVLFPDYEEVDLSEEFDREFREYMAIRKQPDIEGVITLNEIANELNLEITDRLHYLQLLKKEKREKYLLDQLRYQQHLLQSEIKYGRMYIYN
jgi:Lon protease-like protein